jgi:hypothetical protein
MNMGALQEHKPTLNFELVGNANQMGQLQYSVLECVAQGKYDEGAKILIDYRKRKATYPTYEKKTERLFEHCKELIEAIRAKKTFPNLQSLAQSKQEEIHQKARENWEDLKVSLRRIKSIEQDLALSDSKSSVWVIRAMIFSTFMILGTFVLQELFRSFGTSGHMFLEVIVKTFSGVFTF